MPLTIMPYITISARSGGAKKAIVWYKANLHAKVKSVMVSPKNPDRIGHAELEFGNITIMLADPMGPAKTPDDLGGTPVQFFLQYPKGSKGVWENAVKQGATVPEGREYKEQPWGWATGTIICPFGYEWSIGEDVKKWSGEETAEQLGMKDITSEF